MSTTVTFYFDSDFFCTATAIFLDAELTIYADADWYAYNGQKRLWRKADLFLEFCEQC